MYQTSEDYREDTTPVSEQEIRLLFKRHGWTLNADLTHEDAGVTYKLAGMTRSELADLLGY